LPLIPNELPLLASLVSFTAKKRVMNVPTKQKAWAYGLFALSLVLIGLGYWLRSRTGSAFGLGFLGMAIWLWLRFRE
jgi:hypothetical protein